MGDIPSVAYLREAQSTMGLTPREFVAIMGGVHSLGDAFVGPDSSDYVGAWTLTPTEFNNEYFVNLASETWAPWAGSSGLEEFKAVGKELYMQRQDMMLRYDPKLLAIVHEYAQSAELFLSEFAAAWTKLMNADRFDGPFGSVCE